MIPVICYINLFKKAVVAYRVDLGPVKPRIHLRKRFESYYELYDESTHRGETCTACEVTQQKKFQKLSQNNDFHLPINSRVKVSKYAHELFFYMKKEEPHTLLSLLYPHSYIYFLVKLSCVKKIIIIIIILFPKMREALIRNSHAGLVRIGFFFTSNTTLYYFAGCAGVRMIFFTVNLITKMNFGTHSRASLSLSLLLVVFTNIYVIKVT